MTRTGTTRSGRGRKWLLLSGAALVVVAGGAALAARLLIDPEALRQQAIVAVRHQTGRALRLGAIDVRIMPYPSVSIRDFGLSDMAGGARAEMLTAAGLDARVALLPLLHHEIRLEDVHLTRPDLLVERTADGRANWQMTPGPDTRPSGPAGSSSSTRWRVRIGSARVQDAVLAWDDRQGHATGKAALDHVVLDGLTGSAPSLDVLGHRAGDGGASFTLTGHVGALASMQGADAWPVHLAAAALADGRATGSVTLDGTLADPARLRGYDVAVRGTAGRLADLDRLFPHAALPDVRDIDLSAQIVDMASGDGPSIPGLRMLHLRTGPADAGRLAAGLRLVHLAVDAPTPADHVAVQADGTFGEHAFQLHGTLGTLSETLGAWRSRMASGVPVDLVLDSDGGTAHLGGSLGGGQSALDVHATAARLALPGGQVLDRLTADTHVALQGGEIVLLSGLRLDAAQLVLSGEAQFARHGGTGGVPLLTGRLHADRLDLDALRGGQPASSPPTPSSTPTGTAAPAPGPDTMPAAAGPDETILPFDRLHLLDADFDLSAAQFRLGGDDYHDALAHVVLRGGRLVIDPMRADGADRHLDGRLSIDASGDVPRLSGTVGSLVLPAEWAALRVGIPQALHGPVQLVGTLDAQGRTRGALRASLTGHLGVSLVNGTIDGAALGRLVGPAAGAGEGASAGLRCLGIHMALGGGRATLDTIGLQTYRLSVTGHGTVGLAGQDLDLHLLPQLLIGSTGAAMPVAVGGTLQAPRTRLDPAGPGGRYSLTLGPSAGVADPCPATLQAAREGQPGPAPGPAPKMHAPKALDFLRGLGILR
ncbi:AsmA family protein [Gluconacetobacter tumulisoli]|uniref:AsmA family protein n=1 Tax=Gluconacetobacter tumulisoli TaxID=1286189 RepID=A0A7W4PKF2_9PROT|nr:AsmA family protein [Gluconacetobacter tumulisoli]MBB2201337.1 AsmA family protein [Gluconacetobacter tumulisoli]